MGEDKSGPQRDNLFLCRTSTKMAVPIYTMYIVLPTPDCYTQLRYLMYSGITHISAISVNRDKLTLSLRITRSE